PGIARARRSRSSSSTAMSTSLTTEVLPLAHCFGDLPKVLSASAPPSRTAAASNAAASAALRWPSASCNGEALQANGRRIGAVAELEIVGGLDRTEHGDEVARDGHLAHRISALAVLDPEAGGAAAVVAGHLVDAHADQLGDIEAVRDVGDQFVGRLRAGFEMQVGGRRRRRRRHAALGVAGGLEPKLARG